MSLENLPGHLKMGDSPQGQVILASASPRRRQLLAAMGLAFEVMPTDADESLRDEEGAEQAVRRLSLAKALAARDALLARRGAHLDGDKAMPRVHVIAADTVVVDPDGRTILGKPESAEQAKAMLVRLCNRRHDVYSGLALVDVALGDCQVAAVHTSVYMRAYSELEIDRYVASGDPMDKAGAYAIQHAHFAPIARVEGCYANVMGLPMCHLYSVLVGWWRANPRLGQGDGSRFGIRHPLNSCPYALDNAGCPWATEILGQGARPGDPCEG